MLSLLLLPLSAQALAGASCGDGEAPAGYVCADPATAGGTALRFRSIDGGRAAQRLVAAPGGANGESAVSGSGGYATPAGAPSEVPLPGTLLLLGAGALLFGTRRLWRQPGTLTCPSRSPTPSPHDPQRRPDNH